MSRQRRKQHDPTLVQRSGSAAAVNGFGPAVLERPSRKPSGGDSGKSAESASNNGVKSWQFITVCGVLLASFIWSYWPVLGELVAAWDREADYSHGYLVVPVAAFMLWTRWDRRPELAAKFAWGGLILLCLSGLIRIVGSLWFIEFFQAWSIPFWVAGACWFLGGWKLLRWASPAIAFLGFMIPLPFRAETLLSHPLQATASRLSCWLLQILGQPAIREGNVIVINDLELAIVEACSGLRIFVSIFALAFAYAVLIERPWWIKAGMFASILPVALAANAIRIAATGLLHLYVSGEAAHRFSHDLAGWMMIPVAGMLMAGVVWYLGRIIYEVQSELAGEVLLAASSKASTRSNSGRTLR